MEGEMKGAREGVRKLKRECRGGEEEENVV